ncbi:dehydrogenase/reductase SDR family member 11-like isoform X2 [Amphiura filiformis]|uniref:dehydrogenase/reductase SDR family member 11-like isoform X2 n=1 Tax=Amphiura filiformis TaxID=82378 RepID=UPI003B21B698
MSDRWVGRVALVTGASAGIGAAIAKRFAQLGLKVVGCARNIDKIKTLEDELQKSKASGSVHAIKCDVSQETEVLSMFKEIKEKYGGVDVCVNNAGLNHATSIIDGKTEDWKHIFDVNVLGLSICTREAVKSMRERNVDDGHIIHLNSTLGHWVLPISTIHLYSASKHAVTALTEGLRQELREIKSHIRVTSISPGLIKTEFAPRALGQEAADGLYAAIPWLEADDIADAVVYALQAPPHVQVHDIIIHPIEKVS